MKFGELRSIGHNIAASVADGNGFLIGAYGLDVFGEAKRSPAGFIELDFLTGSSCGGSASPSLARAFELYRDALPLLCEKHGVPYNAFRKLSVRFFGHWQFSVTVEDYKGRRATDEYTGVPGARIKTLDPLGRVRKKPTKIARVNVP